VQAGRQAGRQYRTECGEPHEGSTDLTASAFELQTIKARHARERAVVTSRERVLRSLADGRHLVQFKTQSMLIADKKDDLVTAERGLLH